MWALRSLENLWIQKSSKHSKDHPNVQLTTLQFFQLPPTPSLHLRDCFPISNINIPPPKRNGLHRAGWDQLDQRAFSDTLSVKNGATNWSKLLPFPIKACLVFSLTKIQGKFLQEHQSSGNVSPVNQRHYNSSKQFCHYRRLWPWRLTYWNTGQRWAVQWRQRRIQLT